MRAIVCHIFVLFSFINYIEGINKVLGVRDDNPFSSFLVDDAVIGGHIFKEKIAGVRRPDLARKSRVTPETSHEVIFVIKQRNIEDLIAILHDVSDPSSVSYGKHKTKQEVAELTANLESREAVIAYLKSVGATVVSETLNGEYITANGPIKLWENMFLTEFFMFHQTHDVDHVLKVVRAEHYSIPAGLDLHVESVFNTIQMPLQSFGGPIISPIPIHNIHNRNSKDRIQEDSVFERNLITPDKLKVRP
mmetsp:Transcript_11507/g.11150  ORF Transcript_11507/g.11150 Transcript_11507/m.11150 type:complete len:249 (+) Transcript_11507:63-809(+)